MKPINFLYILLFTTFFSSTAFSDEHAVALDGNVTLTSDYVFRGISQTDENPAIQGGFDISGDLLYAGVWGSNANYDGASGEFDIYLGLTKDLGPISMDFGVVHYDYPGNSSLNTEDVYLISGFKSFELGIYQTTSADWFGVDNAAGTQYIYGAYTLALNETISAGFSYGQTITQTFYQNNIQIGSCTLTKICIKRIILNPNYPLTTYITKNLNHLQNIPH